MDIVKPLILSVSRRTDIPAFFMSDFLSSWKKGWTEWVNPFNPKQRKIVSFENVQVVVFWSKYPIGILRNIEKLDFPFYLLYTLNDYPELEKKLPSLDKRLGLFKELSKLLGSERVIWRFDPVVTVKQIPLDEILLRFERLAKELSGYTAKVITSFMTPYSKVLRRLGKYGFDYYEPKVSEIVNFASEMVKIAEDAGMKIQSCADRFWMYTERVGLKRGACIDAQYIASVFKNQVDVQAILSLKKDKGQRKECLCAESVDIGKYGTCRFECLYCYAV